MAISKEIMDKIRDALDDQGELYPWTIGAEVLAGITEAAEQDKVSATDKKSDKSVGKTYENLGYISATESVSATDKKSTKPRYKTYEDLAYISAMEAARCGMLINKLKAAIDLLNAQQQYYEAMSAIERDNESFGFDLDI